MIYNPIVPILKSSTAHASNRLPNPGSLERFLYRESQVVVQRFGIQAGAGTGRVALGGGTVRSPRTPQVIIRGTDQ